MCMKCEFRKLKSCEIVDKEHCFLFLDERYNKFNGYKEVERTKKGNMTLADSLMSLEKYVKEAGEEIVGGIHRAERTVFCRTLKE